MDYGLKHKYNAMKLLEKETEKNHGIIAVGQKDLSPRA